MTDQRATVKALLDTLPSASFALDAQLRYVAFNEAHARTMQARYQTTPKIGLELLSLMTAGPDRENARGNLNRALAGETVVAEDFLSELTHTPVRDETGRICTLLVLGQPKGHRFLSDATELDDIAYWSYDGDSGATVYSAGYFTMLGYQPDQFPASFESWVNLIHPHDRDATLAAFRQFFQVPRGDFNLEYRLKTAHGGWRWILGKGRVTERYTNGLPRRVAGGNIDVTQRRLMAEALTESEARWNTLVSQAPVCITLLGRLGTVMFSSQHNPVTGGDLAIGRHWRDVVPTAYVEAFATAFAGVLAGTPSTLEVQLNPELGLSVYENRLGPVKEGGQVTSVMMVSLDVSDRVRQQTQLKKSTRRRQILLHLHEDQSLTRQGILDGALEASVELTDSQIGYIYFYSEETQLFTLHSWSNGAMARCRVTQPQTTYDLGLTGYWGEVVRQRRAICVNDFQVPSPYHRGMPEGHVELRRFLTVPVFDGPAIVAVIGVANKAAPYEAYDTSELEALADGLWQLLRKRETDATLLRLYQAVEHSPAAVVITDQDGTIHYVNAQFGPLTGYPSEKALGANIGILDSPTTPEAEKNDVWTTLRNGKEWQGDLTNRRPTGEDYPVHLSISPVRDREGAITHFISIMEDLTDRKNATELLQRAAKLETMGTLAAGVAHDFNNLLTSVLGYNSMLLRKLPPEDPRHLYAEKIEISGHRAAELVSRLLAVGRQQRMTTEVFDLVRFLRDQLPLLRSLVKPPMELVAPLEGPELRVKADAGQLSQVVVNLVSNARDSLGSQGRIELSVGCDDSEQHDQAWFQVRDNGPGISRDLQKRIFDPFFTTKTIGHGTGLGLSVVYGIVEQHHGRIEVASEPGDGATFTVYLPRQG